MISNPSSPIGMVLAPDIQRTGVEVERLLEEMGMKEDQDAVARRKQERREVPGEVEWVGRIVCLKDKNASQDQVLEVIGKLRASPRVLSAGPMLDARDFWDSDVYFQIEGPDPAFLEAYLKEMGGEKPQCDGRTWRVVESNHTFCLKTRRPGESTCFVQASENP